MSQKHLEPENLKRGANPDNMAPQVVDPSTNCGGFDTLEVSIYGRLTTNYKSDTWRQIHRAQDCARQGDEQHAVVRLNNNRVLQVARTGAGRGHAFLPYRVQCEGITIGLAGPMASDEDRIAKIEIGSLMLISKGHRACWDLAQEILEDIGIKITKDVVARADVCLDLPGIDVNDFVELWASGKRVTRARKGGMYVDGLRSTGFDHGASGCRIRVYDKRAEMEGSEGTAKFCAIRDIRWGGVVPQKATRVEFQTRRDFIRDTLGIESVEEYFAKIGDITRHLVNDWFRLTKEDPDAKNKNQSKAENAECWKRVVVGFERWAGQVTHRIQRRRAALPDMIALERQLVGVLETIAAASPKLFRDNGELLKLCTRSFARVDAARQRGDSSRKRVASKRAKMAAAGVLGYITDQHQLNQIEAWETHPSDCYCETCCGM